MEILADFLICLSTFECTFMNTHQSNGMITIASRLRYDYDPTTIRLRRIERACFHSTQFDASKKWTCQFFVVVVS